jgi:hypothetical protein
MSNDALHYKKRINNLKSRFLLFRESINLCLYHFNSKAVIAIMESLGNLTTQYTEDVDAVVNSADFDPRDLI